MVLVSAGLPPECCSPRLVLLLRRASSPEGALSGDPSGRGLSVGRQPRHPPPRRPTLDSHDGSSAARCTGEKKPRQLLHVSLNKLTDINSM